MEFLGKMREACRVTDLVFGEMVNGFSGFKTEKQAADFLVKRIKAHGCYSSFPPIVAAGKNGSEPHHKPGGARLQGFVVIDFGAAFKGIKADMTRTVFVGRPSLEEKRFYGLVLRAQRAGVKALKPGVLACNVDKAARDCFGAYAKNFVHGTGHGLGRKIHEKPLLKRKSRAKIREGMVVTVEPGLYFKGAFGARVEDDYLVVRGGAERLTLSPRKLLCFGVRKAKR